MGRRGGEERPGGPLSIPEETSSTAWTFGRLFKRNPSRPESLGVWSTVLRAARSLLLRRGIVGGEERRGGKGEGVEIYMAVAGVSLVGCFS